MHLIGRVLRILISEGPSGVFRRLRARLGQHSPNIEMLIDKEKEEYQQERDRFKQYIKNIDLPGLPSFYWYHTVDLGNGIVTPGDYDYRHSLPSFHFPDDMYGMKVLDVGSATGFFSFEFERRGAKVVSVELPSLHDWDIIHDEKAAVILSIMAECQATSPEDAYYRHLKGPFDFCHSQRKSSVRRVFSPIYDLTAEILGDDQFDIVFLGDILLHLFAPLKALNVIAPLCKDRLIIGTDLFADPGEAPSMRFLGTVSKKMDHRTWWAFNRVCMEEMLRRVGFRDVKLVGNHSGIGRRAWWRYERYVFHGRK